MQNVRDEAFNIAEAVLVYPSFYDMPCATADLSTFQTFTGSKWSTFPQLLENL